MLKFLEIGDLGDEGEDEQREDFGLSTLFLSADCLGLLIGYDYSIKDSL
jgi:hypothetical protein